MNTPVLNDTRIPFQLNSLQCLDEDLMSYDTKLCVSPWDFQPKKNTSTKTKKSKKIILGKPCSGKQKMDLQELKALSRQIKPSASIPLNTFNARVQKEVDSIHVLSRHLREKLSKAKSKMLDDLKNSNVPQDVEIYNHLVHKSNLVDSDSVTHNSDDEDECSSVSTLSSVQVRLVTDASGHASVVSDDCSSLSSSTTCSLFDSFEQENHPLFGDDSNTLPIYTPSYSSPMLDMDLFLQHPWPAMKTDMNDVTEDQINLWLQRGGHSDSVHSPITMATDQELADLIDLDNM